MRLLEFCHYMRLWMLPLSHVCHKRTQRMKKKRKVVENNPCLRNQVTLTYSATEVGRHQMCVYVWKQRWLGREALSSLKKLG